MNSRAVFLVTCAGGIALGLSVGGIVSRGAHDRAHSRVALPTKSADRQASDLPSGTPVEAAHDFAGLKRLVRFGAERECALLSREIGKLDTPALRGLLLGMAAEADSLEGVEQHVVWREYMKEVAKVHYLRHGDAAMEWAMEIEDRSLRERTVRAMVVACVSVDFVAARPWVEKARGEIGEAGPYQYMPELMKVAAEQGADSLLEARRLYGPMEGYSWMFCFPEGFDFARYLKGVQDPFLSSQVFIRQWSVRDREAAFAHVMESIVAGKPAKQYFTAFFGGTYGGMASCEGQQQATSYLIGKFDQFNEEQRHAAIDAMYAGANNFSKEDLAASMLLLPEESDRNHFIRGLAKEYGSLYLDKVGYLVRQLGDEEARTEYLLNWAREDVASRRPGKAAGNDVFSQVKYQKLADGAGLSHENKIRVIETIDKNLADHLRSNPPVK